MELSQFLYTEQQLQRSLRLEESTEPRETGVQGGQSSVTGSLISVSSQGGLSGVLQTVQMVAWSGYGVVVSPGVRHLPELLSVTDLTGVHGDIWTTMATVMEIFGLPVILTNIDFMKINNIYQIAQTHTHVNEYHS